MYHFEKKMKNFLYRGALLSTQEQSLDNMHDFRKTPLYSTCSRNVDKTSVKGFPNSFTTYFISH